MLLHYGHNYYGGDGQIVFIYLFIYLLSFI